jgi:hypothetical protein
VIERGFNRLLFISTISPAVKSGVRGWGAHCIHFSLTKLRGSGALLLLPYCFSAAYNLSSRDPLLEWHRKQDVLTTSLRLFYYYQEFTLALPSTKPSTKGHIINVLNRSNESRIQLQLSHSLFPTILRAYSRIPWYEIAKGTSEGWWEINFIHFDQRPL